MVLGGIALSYSCLEVKLHFQEAITNLEALDSKAAAHVKDEFRSRAHEF